MEYPSVGSSHTIMQTFEPNGADFFGLQAGMEMLGFPASKPLHSNPSPWQADDFSVRDNQGLSLSLSKPNPSDGIEFHQQQYFMEDGSNGRIFQSQQLPYQLKRSKYLIPAQQLLSEFCSLGRENNSRLKKKEEKASQWEEGGASSLYSMDIGELQKRKIKLLSMLEEVYRRYRRYCEQMRAVVSSFEAVAGEGSATVYSTLASKAMSRHFRCLKDGIMGQIQATKMAMGEKDGISPGTTKGETPRLKKLEQCLRQQRAFHQAGLMESQPWRPQRGLPERSVSILRAWLFEHFLHPYPSDVDKHILARQTGLSRSQVSNWFINARVRLWKPMVEEMYLEELKEEDSPNPNPSSSSLQLSTEDQKPTSEQLFNDSGSLSSIINSHHQSIRSGDPMINSKNPNYSVVDMDFPSYTGSDVSLTLGLQQHDSGGMSLSFSSNSQHSLLFSGEHMDDGQPVQFTILDGEGQHLPYRNLMGTQLLNDLAG